MSYATVSDVTDLFRNIDLTNTDTAVDAVKIQRWLDNASYAINARLSQIYNLTPPITTNLYPEAFSILGQIEAFYVAGIVDDVLNTYDVDEKKPYWEKRAEAMLTMYAPSDCKACAPTSVLPGVPYIGNNTERGVIRISRTSTAPIFRKGENNW